MRCLLNERVMNIGLLLAYLLAYVVEMWKCVRGLMRFGYGVAMEDAQHRRGPILSSSFCPIRGGYVICLVDMAWRGIEIVGCGVVQ